MRWFRSHSILGSRLALSALVLQLVLSFGHVHVPDISRQGHPLAAASLAALPHAGQALPADREVPEHEDGYCAIYAINALINSSQHSEPPALPLPRLADRARPVIGNEFHLAERRHVLSQARAPPLA